jgi:hypothetical protein
MKNIVNDIVFMKTLFLMKTILSTMIYNVFAGIQNRAGSMASRAASQGRDPAAVLLPAVARGALSVRDAISFSSPPPPPPASVSRRGGGANRLLPRTGAQKGKGGRGGGGTRGRKGGRGGRPDGLAVQRESTVGEQRGGRRLVRDAEGGGAWSGIQLSSRIFSAEGLPTGFLSLARQPANQSLNSELAEAARPETREKGIQDEYSGSTALGPQPCSQCRGRRAQSGSRRGLMLAQSSTHRSDVGAIGCS